jgi:hypothetical protein
LVCPALALAVVLVACKSKEGQGAAGSASVAATTASSAVPAASSSAPANAQGSAGHCKRLKPGTSEPMCNLAHDVCCENAATGQERCVPRAQSKGNHCGDDGAWLVAMNCTTSSMCGPAQKCCVQEPSSGFLQTVCAPTCQHEEVCVPNLPGGGCKDATKFDCVASESSRTGGRCVAKSGAQTQVVKCGAGQVRIVAAGKPGGVCAETCGSICAGGVNPVEATLLKDDGTPGGKVEVHP